MRGNYELPILPKGEDRTWWRTLAELADEPEVLEYLHREFPQNASEGTPGPRREFLRLLGATLFLASGSGCNIRQPKEAIVPVVTSADHSLPGLPLYFSTAMDLAGAAIGLTVQSRDGRPVKIEGNANHPASLGATNLFAQAATLDLYDPDRGRAPTLKGKITSIARLNQAMRAVRAKLDREQGRGLRLLCSSSSSPTMARLFECISHRWPRSKWFVYESVNDDKQRLGMSLAYGQSAASFTPIYDFRRAEVVLSIDHDFLGNRDSPPCYVRQFADARRIVGSAKREFANRTAPSGEQSSSGAKSTLGMVRLYHLGPTPTTTAAKADYSLALPPSELPNTLRAIAWRIGVETDGGDTEHSAWSERLAADFRSAGSKALVVVGREQPAMVHALAHAINEQTGAVGTCVRYVESPQVRPRDEPSDAAMLQRLTEEMLSGKVSELLVLGGNPAFGGSAKIPFAEALQGVDFSLALGASVNETSQLCDWFVPCSHFLEGWSDARSYDGVASIVQPLISPMYESLTDVELLATLCEDAVTGYAAVRKTWKERLGDEDADPRWQSALAEGVISGTYSEEKAFDFDRTILAAVARSPQLARKRASGSEPWAAEIVFRPDPTIWDGRFANNGWLQELPKPLSHVVWDNPAWIAPADAARMQLANGDVVRIETSDMAMEVAIWIMPGHARNCLTLFTGYGRAVVGRVGNKTGVNTYPLRNAVERNMAIDEPPNVMTIVATGKRSRVVSTQHHQMMEGRNLARAGSIAEYLLRPEEPPFAHPSSPEPKDSFYQEWPYEHVNKWGMTIDLTACVGCSACVLACQAENNIPVVGKEQCDNNRHMHWLRVDTYFQGPAEHPMRTLHQPVPCMQCERAPCEVVCPVAATNHSDDGLNQMIYNRCVGTRYCSNNCPYKVRRFNFFDFSDDFISDPSLHLLSNPEVTMRSRGVMEKCTYCVQRIEQARIAMQLAGRPIRDGDIKTACQAVCPAQAIRFGDLNDLTSEVRQAQDHPLNYAMLEELNTKPRTTYLAEVFNIERPGNVGLSSEGNGND